MFSQWEVNMFFMKTRQVPNILKCDVKCVQIYINLKLDNGLASTSYCDKNKLY